MNVTRQLKAYIAAPIFTPEQLRLVETIIVLLQDSGMDYFSPYHASRDIWAGRKPAECSPAERMQVLRGNIQNVDDSDLVIAVLGMTDLNVQGAYDKPKVFGKTDTGVVWECSRATTRAGDPTLQPDHDVIGGGNSQPCLLGYVDSRDIRQGKNINLMLAGTIEAMAKGMHELAHAITLFADLGGPSMCQTYNPERIIGHEE